MELIGIVLVSYCGVNDTLECVDSIVKCNDGIKKLVAIIDNASPTERISTADFASMNVNVFTSDTIPQNIKKLDSLLSILIINSERNGGFGYANNIGIKYIQQIGCDICILLNNDTVLPPDFFIKTVSLFKDKKIDLAISPKSINYYNQNEIDSEGFGYFDPCTGRSSHKKKYKIDYLVGSCILMNNCTKIPLFDENFFLYCEDVDYSFSLRSAGYQLAYDANNFFYHKVSASTSKNSSLYKIKLRSMKYLMLKRESISHNISFYVLRTLYYLTKGNWNLLKILWQKC